MNGTVKNKTETKFAEAHELTGYGKVEEVKKIHQELGLGLQNVRVEIYLDKCYLKLLILPTSVTFLKPDFSKIILAILDLLPD